MLLSSLRQRSFPAWCGIFAILTIFIAPAISQTLAHCRHGGLQALDAPANSTERRHHVGHDISGAHAPSHPGSDPAADHQACGYCVLFCHAPALSGIAGIAVAARRRPTRSRIITPLSAVIPFGRFASPMPRAPPR
ncbi:DUF2946 domain-containing protein [Brenneria populi]|uniref:DUF2946 domain-containing protein n=1 Tax=Brenneria populi TaxID=1505588 RepID=A0ABU6JKB2_9GAMM|nr:DUF2946 domain-containing protein [Brenneria populi Li et al. 2015]